MSRGKFVSKWEPEYQAACDALEKTAPHACGVFASYVQPRWTEYAERQFGKRVRSNAASWWGWVLRRPRDYRRINDWALPGSDHTEYWEKDGERTLVTHPYGIGWEDLRALVRKCEAEGLEARIDSLSWYYPTATIAIVVRMPGWYERERAKETGEAA